MVPPHLDDRPGPARAVRKVLVLMAPIVDPNGLVVDPTGDVIDLIAPEIDPKSHR